MPWGSRGVPCQVQPGGVPWSGGTVAGRYPVRGSTLARGYPGWGGTLAGGVPCLGGYPGWRGYPGWGGTLARGVPWLGGYPVRTTWGVLAIRRAVCLLRSRRRTFLFILEFRDLASVVSTITNNVVIFQVIFHSSRFPLDGHLPSTVKQILAPLLTVKRGSTVPLSSFSTLLFFRCFVDRHKLLILFVAVVLEFIWNSLHIQISPQPN